jgi:hypothetical protein
MFKFKVANPKFALIMALLEGIGTFTAMLIFNTNIQVIMMFLIVTSIIKIIPVYTLLNTTVSKRDIKITVVLGLIYSFWLLIINKKSPFYLLDLRKELVLNNSINTASLEAVSSLFW